MHNILSNVEEINNHKTDLLKEYKESLKDKNFKSFVSKLKIDDNILMKYTSILEESACEFKNCCNCKGLVNCKNKMEGFAYLPRVNGDNLIFEYKPCKFKNDLVNKEKYLNNIKYFNIPVELKNASINDIYKTDKKRFKVINWLLDFLDSYKDNPHQKGLYLHGNFGCGKSYLVAAILNELAKQNVKSAIIFWPEFLRQAFYNDFNEKFDYVKNVEILLIDDIGAEKVTEWNRDEILCPLLQYRMDNHLTTFFTSNLTIDELKQLLSISKSGVDEVKAGRIIARIEQLTEDIEMISKNLRS